MKINSYARQVTQPGSAGGALRVTAGVAAQAASKGFAKIGAVTGEMAALKAELDARMRASERSMRRERLKLDYKSEVVAEFDKRSVDPLKYATLEEDSRAARYRARERIIKQALDDPELEHALAFELDQIDASREVVERQAARNQAIGVARGTLVSTINDAANLYSQSSPLEKAGLEQGIDAAIAEQLNVGAIKAEEGFRLRQGFIDNAKGNELARLVESAPEQVLEVLQNGGYPDVSDSVRLRAERGARDEIARRTAEAAREQARAERRAEARERNADRALTSVGRILDEGVMVDAATLANARSLVIGTAREVELDAMLANYDDRVRFVTHPLWAQAAEVYQRQRQAQTQGVDALGLSELQARERVYASAQEAAKRDPLVAARDRGVIDELPPVDLRTGDALAESLAERRMLADQVSVWTGWTVSPLTKDETAALAQSLAGATTQGRRDLLVGLRRALDEPRYLATLRQLGADSPLPAYAGALAVQERQASTFSPGSASALVLDGDALLHPADGGKAFPMPTEPERRDVFNDAVREAFEGAPEAYAQVRQAADAAYAALSARAGDYSAEIDDDRYHAAVAKVTGGIVKINGRRVVKPFTLSEEQFRTAIDNTSAAQIAQLGGVAEYTDEQAAEAVREGQLVNYGDGYAVRDGGRLLVGHDGRVFVWRP